jgi:CRISPR-associated RAMP protein (TIGR02581 family)
MLKRRLCEARFTWKLSCEGPLLIADGRYEKKKAADEESKKIPTKVFISRTPEKELKKILEHAYSAESLNSLAFFVPGTSLRGPVRAQAERILRTVLSGDPPNTACDPFQMEEVPTRSCSKRLDEKHAEFPYASVCPACRLFGCTGTASRIQISDADVGKSARSVYRDMIGIDRFTGGSYSGAKMRFHALEGASFETTVAVTNFELWQLGLLAFVFRDFEESLVSIGFGKTKGFGQVTGKIQNVEIAYPRGRQQGKLQDLYSLATDAEREQYGLHPHEAPELKMEAPKSARLDFYETFQVDVEKLWAAAAETFLGFVETTQGKAA